MYVIDMFSDKDRDFLNNSKPVSEGENWDKLTPQQKAHEYNLDAAQKEMDRRHEQGEDMSGAKIDKKTYKIVKPKQQGVAEDHEIQMASSELQSIAKNAEALLHMVRKYSEQQGLDAWQQSKITKAADYLNAVLQSVSGEQTELESVGVPSYGVGGYRNRGDDERHDLDDPELQRNRQEVTSYNITIDGKPINPKPIFGRSATIAWGKKHAATGVDLSNAVISPVRYEESVDPYFESLTNKLDRLKKK
jgi:hypothetical protein